MSFRRAWLRFLRAGRTLGPTPGVREAWARGGSTYHAWVLEIDDPRVVARRDAVRALLEQARPGCTSAWCALMLNTRATGSGAPRSGTRGSGAGVDDTRRG